MRKYETVKLMKRINDVCGLGGYYGNKSRDVAQQRRIMINLFGALLRPACRRYMTGAGFCDGCFSWWALEVIYFEATAVLRSHQPLHLREHACKWRGYSWTLLEQAVT